MKSNKKHLFSWFVMPLGLLIISSLAYANLADTVVGTYTGTITDTESSCSPPSEDGTESISITLDVIKLGTNSFQGSRL